MWSWCDTDGEDNDERPRVTSREDEDDEREEFYDDLKRKTWKWSAGMKLQEDHTGADRGGGSGVLGGVGVGGCGVVTSSRGVLHSTSEEKPRLRRRDATKAPSTADAAFTRRRRAQWIYWTLAWGKLWGFIPFYFPSSASAGDQLVSKTHAVCPVGFSWWADMALFAVLRFRICKYKHGEN